jgi:hypothetical protein
MKAKPFWVGAPAEGAMGGGAAENVTSVITAVEVISNVAVMKMAIVFLFTTLTDRNTSFLYVIKGFLSRFLDQQGVF